MTARWCLACWRCGAALARLAGIRSCAASAASAAFITYNGYWLLAPSSSWCTCSTRDGRRCGSASKRALWAGVGFVSVPMAIMLVQLATGAPLLFSGMQRLAGTVTDGYAPEGFSVTWAYLWHAEHGLLLVWLVAALFVVFEHGRVEPATASDGDVWIVSARVHLSRPRRSLCAAARLRGHGTAVAPGRAVLLPGDGRCGRAVARAAAGWVDRRRVRGSARAAGRVEFPSAAAAAIPARRDCRDHGEVRPRRFDDSRSKDRRSSTRARAIAMGAAQCTAPVSSTCATTAATVRDPRGDALSAPVAVRAVPVPRASIRSSARCCATPTSRCA